MARKTKAEREAEAQAAREQREAEARAAYPALLMNALERATILSFELEVRNGTFRVRDRNSPNDSWELTYEYTLESDDILDSLQRELAWQEEKEAEANRKWLARQAALSKLSDYERELLGL